MLRRLFDEFGRKEADWLPYWKNAEYVSVQPEGAYASLYRHPRNGVLLVVSNLTEGEKTVVLNLNLQKLGLPAQVSACDALSQEAVTCSGGRLDIALPYLGWRVVWVKPSIR